MRVCVTGASGFIGRHLTTCLQAAGHEVVATVRDGAEVDGATLVHRVDVTVASGWAEALSGCQVVIHLAGRAHVLDDGASDPLVAFRSVNVDGALRVAVSAHAAGVSRFVFVSSIGVNGNASIRPFRADDEPAPVEAYALSKLEAELALRDYCTKVGMELVIVRPTLVYGPGCPGNFLRLLKLIGSRLPLPLASVRCQRSYIGVRNLAEMLERCIWVDAAAGRVLLAADGEDIALPRLLHLLAAGMRCPVRLWPLPKVFLRAGGLLLGRSALVERLVGSLQVDAEPTFIALNWRPSLSLKDGLFETGSWYTSSRLIRPRAQ